MNLGSPVYLTSLCFSFPICKTGLVQVHSSYLKPLDQMCFIYLCLAALGPRCCARAFSSCGERGLLFVAVRGLLIAVASLAAEHGL